MQNFRNVEFEWASGSGDKAMALYQYFQPSDGLPDASGPLSASVSPAAIKDLESTWVKGVWQCAGAYENKNTKISSEGVMAIYMKICTSQNFPLYGSLQKHVAADLKTQDS